MWIKKLKTSTFRNLQQVDLTLQGPGVYVLYGHNGAGKTNILEVISLLSPGQGLHRDKLENMLPDPHEGEKAKQWGFYGEVVKNDETHTIGVGYDRKKRMIKIDGEETAGQADLANLGAVLWFTPEMDRLFFGSPSGRRRFYDRLVFGLHPQHAAKLTRYTKHLQSRMQLLKDPQADPDWVALEEQQAAHFGADVVKARLAYLEELTPYLEGVTLELTGNAERTYLEALKSEQESEQDPEQAFIAEFAERRPRDMRQKSNSFGPQRTDLEGMLILEDGTEVPLSRTSMGQHKKALIKLLIGAARLQHERTGHPPCILLDEIATHLDEEARGLLYEKLLPLGGQLWLTGTEKTQFAGLEGAHFIGVKGGIATPEFGE